jgi:hypothetical protein
MNGSTTAKERVYRGYDEIPYQFQAIETILESCIYREISDTEAVWRRI